VIYGLVPINFL